jgi:hypothetical protein
MAGIYFTNNTYLLLGTHVMSTVVQSASLNINYDQLEITAMGDAAHKYLKGLAAHTLSGTLYLNQDAIAAGATRAVLDSLKGDITPAIEVEFEAYAKMGINKCFREQEKQTDVYYLCWLAIKRSGQTVAVFGEAFLNTLKAVEVLDSDPLAG